MQQISSQRICEINTHVRDLPRCYKSYIFFRERQYYSFFMNTNPILFPLRLPPSRIEHMHYSLGGAGLGHTSVSRVNRYMDLVGCVLVPVAVGQGAPWPASWSLKVLSPKVAWHLGRLFLRGMLMGLRQFLEPPGLSGPWPCAWTHQKKKPCATLVQSVGQTTNTNFLPAVKPDSSKGYFSLLY